MENEFGYHQPPLSFPLFFQGNIIIDPHQNAPAGKINKRVIANLGKDTTIIKLKIQKSNVLSKTINMSAVKGKTTLFKTINWVDMS